MFIKFTGGEGTSMGTSMGMGMASRYRAYLATTQNRKAHAVFFKGIAHEELIGPAKKA